MDYLVNNITSDRLLFRKLTPSDFELWLPFHEDKRTSKFWNGLPKDPRTACEADFERTFYRYKNKLGGKFALIGKQNNKLLGLAGLLIQEVNHKKELEIAYSLLPEYWGFGYALEAATECKIFAQKNNLSTSLISIIHIDNIPSQNVAIRNGMTLDFETTYHDNPVYIFRTIR
ncbi:GNAT family N-acetyltransferase [Cellulophaga sp. E16_2]|uniref:GNAT family N-acetyltransferase n=1 Tax=unclassified Cellulophaga TaxID=2634405 RepID=UPI0013FDF423|nr:MULTISPECIES: GNAT family N-acetyltransferase [unclassified Cellulophaga]MBO0590302.1 GNAT family N-acetyltransferase [Cellulophaga sp. E16_2]